MKNFWNCIIYDIRQGTIKQKNIYFIAVIVFFFWAMNSYTDLRLYLTDISMWDILIKLFYGADIYFKGDLFHIPYMYMITTAFFGISIGSYVINDYQSMGVTHIIKYKNKNVWWYGKCAWNIWHTMLLMMSVFLGVFLFGCMTGSVSWTVNEKVSDGLSYPIIVTDSFPLFIYIFLLSFITIIVLNQIQITLQMMFDFVTPYIIYLGNLVLSVLIYSRYLPGNNLMLCRTRIFHSDGIGIGFEMIYLFALWIAAVLAGRWYLNRRDMLV